MLTTIIQATSGLGMFLFGMLYMELALKEAAGVRFKNWIKKSTSTTFKSLLTGAGATAILQSSSVVTLMTMSFISTSLISFSSGIALIFGSNLGTTATAWIVATLGFQVKIEAFALPMIGLGGLLLMTVSHHKIISMAKVLIGFGLLFFGLDIMKTAIESIAHTIDLASYSNYPLIAFVAIGFIITALIQSSSAATAIILSALYVQLLSFEQSAAMVIGTNIGTTATALLGSIGGIPDKKRTAMAHLLFNFITATIAFMLLPLLTYFLMKTLSMGNNPTMALAMFHTIFNLLGILILTPFIPLISKYLKKTFIQKEAVYTKFIHSVDPTLPDTAFIALRNEVSNLFIKTIKYALLLHNIKPFDVINKKLDLKELIEENMVAIDFDHVKAYEIIKEIEIDIVSFVNILTQQNLTLEQSESIETLLMSVRESVYSAKILKDIKNNVNDFAESENTNILDIYNLIRKNLAYSIYVYLNYMDEKYTMAKCKEKILKAENENKRIMKLTTMSMSAKGIHEKSVVSLLNTNTSVNIAVQSLFQASNVVTLHFVFDDK